MALTLVYSFLAVLEFIPAMAFTSNIHEMMTPGERLAVFGSEDSVPEYQLFPISLSGVRRSSEADEEIKMTIELKGKEVKLNFKPTTGYLASKSTPVLSAVTDKNAYNEIRYDPLPLAMTEIGEFKMYHDQKNEGAIVVYNDPTETVIEGIITSGFAIRSLPKRLMGETLKLGDYFVETPIVEKRSIISDGEEVTGYLVIFKVPAAGQNAKRSILDNTDHLQRGARRRRNELPAAVYPEILIALDHNAVRNRTITQVLRFMVAFWNGVDLVYSSLDEPKVHLNIAGMIIAADDTATPYIAETASATMKEYAADILDYIGIYFYEERIRFPLEHFDMIIGMTTMQLCEYDIDPCDQFYGVADIRHACPPMPDGSGMRAIGGAGILYYNWKFGGVHTAAHEAAHLFGVYHDDDYGEGEDCDMREGYAMAASAHYAHQNFKWSNCSKAYFRDYFLSKESNCLDNEPLWNKPVREVLGGRWLTKDGQCRNEGYESACELTDIPICLAKGCKSKETDECVPSSWQTLPGTKCGDKKYCSSKNNCEDEL